MSHWVSSRLASWNMILGRTKRGSAEMSMLIMLNDLDFDSGQKKETAHIY